MTGSMFGTAEVEVHILPVLMAFFEKYSLSFRGSCNAGNTRLNLQSRA